MRSARNGRNRNVIEPSQMESRLVNGTADPQTTPDHVVFTRPLIGTALQFGAGSTGNISMANILIYENQSGTGSASTTATRFLAGRIKRIEVWDTAANEATDNALVVSISSVPYGDAAVFRDYGTPGERRAHVAIIPNFAFREHWFLNTDTSVLFMVPQGTTSNTTIIRLTLELR